MNIDTLLNSLTKRIEHWNLRKLTKLMTLMGFVIAIFTSWFWYQDLYMTPERRFWAAINNSMATPSVVRTLTDGGTGNQVTQDYRFNFAPQLVIENKVELTEKSATTDTAITTEGVITQSGQYLRYSNFRSNNQQGLFSENDESLLGVWASGGLGQPTAEEAALNYASEQVSLAIFGNFAPEFRNSIVQNMRDNEIYGDSLSEAKDGEIDGRATLEYSISVKLRDYVQLLQQSFIQAGLGEFPPLAADNYREEALVNGTIVVDKATNTIVVVSFGGRTETYSNYGVIKTVDIPEATLTIDELQSQVQTSIETGI